MYLFLIFLLSYLVRELEKNLLCEKIPSTLLFKKVVWENMKNKTLTKQDYAWAVIGAGPAGIAAVGKLLDQGIAEEEILWVDPAFKVGDFGTKWRNVSSNTTVKKFLSYLDAIKAFNYQSVSKNFPLQDLEPEETCLLSFVADPLQWVTETLRSRVCSYEATIEQLSLADRRWWLKTSSLIFNAKQVILATGASPLGLNYKKPLIPFEIAIDKEKLAQTVSLNESIAVFGSSHSAVVILQNLVELGVKKIINFYRSPCRYAIDYGDWILFDDTGLKGNAAAWARQNLDGVLPKNLIRYEAHASNVENYLDLCDEVVYAIGFKRRDLQIEYYSKVPYDPYNGIIAPGLFGFGIAYPEAKADPLGALDYRVGLYKFMEYLNRIFPIWLNYPA